MNDLYNHSKVKSYMYHLHMVRDLEDIVRGLHKVVNQLLTPGWSGQLDFLDKN